jgi:hypothetical protein
MIKKLKEEVAELKAKLAKAMLKESFAATKTDKAILVHETEELNVGTEVFVEDEEGKRIPAEDGIYTLEGGKRVKVTEGKVEEILEAEEETEAEETEVEAAEETPEETPAEEYATKAEVEALATAVADLTAVVNDLIAKVDGVNEAFSARLSKVEQMPAGKTPAEEFKNEREVKTGDSVLDRKLENIRRFKK